MFALQFVIEYVVPTLALIGLGGYLEHKFGAKLAARVAVLETKVHGAEAKVAAVDAAVKQAAK
jgi:hypothetical protein